MKRLIRLAVLVLAAAATLLFQLAAVPDSLSSLDPKEAGQILAARLRSLAPAEESQFKGALNIRRGRTRIIPLTLTIAIEPAGWKAIYETSGSDNVPAEKLIVVHGTNRPNEYRFVQAAKPGESPGALRCLANTEAALPFAGSDFWLTDFGLEFLHWPSQRLLRTEMRKSRVCHVLESVQPRPVQGQYGRVISWVDKESGGIILAEGYDHATKLLKEFSIGKVTKVEGQWQLEEMEIRNVQTKSRTRLEFVFDAGK
jgi:Outer membrane lipoprotein-sorting protein